MGILDPVRTMLWNFMLPAQAADIQAPQRQAAERHELFRGYQRGQQRQQLRVKPGQADDNVTVNFLGLIIERGVSMLFGQGISFDLPGDEETQQDLFIQAVWKANRQGILLHKLGQLAGTYGTGYLKILPVENRDPAWRLMALNPRLMWIDAAPHDMDMVTAYTQRYATFEKGEDVAHKIVTARNKAVVLRKDGQMIETDEYADAWSETHYVANKATAGRFEQLGDVVDWPYPFAPIVHWQNLPDGESCYGLSDLEDVIGLQDRYNFIQSNNSKIVRYHAHPKTWGTGTSMEAKKSWGADEMVWLQGGGAGGSTPTVQNLEMQSDLASSRQLAQDIRQALFDIARTVDSSSMADTLGQLTNFGLRTLFMDAINKTHTKRELYGEALLETNRRLLVLAGASGDAADPGEIVWPDPLPTNEIEQTQALTADLGLGIASKQTVAGLRDYDWEQEQERMSAEGAATDNVGSALLRAFGQGR